MKGNITMPSPINLFKTKFASKILKFLNYWNLQQQLINGNVHETARVDVGVRINSEVKVGRNSYINGPDTLILSGEVGSFCSISWGVTIGASEHPIHAVSTHPFWYNKSEWGGKPGEKPLWSTEAPPPKIGNDVWIGANVTILRGAVIEDGAVIGAGSIVRGNIPAYSIAVGSPARVIKNRFDESTVKEIQNSKWWQWDDEKIKGKAHLFMNPEEFIKQIK